MNAAASPTRRTQYRSFDIQTRVVGQTGPFACGFTLIPLDVAGGSRIVRMCFGQFRTVEDAHAEAQLAGQRLVDMIHTKLEAQQTARQRLGWLLGGQA